MTIKPQVTILPPVWSTMIILWSLVAVVAGQENMNYNPLTPDEEYVIVQKGTERPYSGEYTDHTEQGVYICKRCDAPLFRSANKFDSHCGWPSFDDMIDGAVRQVPDADGRRTEILCTNCGGHLGHVFSGEGYTSNNTRHCVNSIALKFVGTSPATHTERAIFASGCFWGTEYHLAKMDGVISTTVGYTGGHKENPTYQQVSAGNTGHAEAIEVIFDPSQVTYEEIARLFFETHDPTQLNRQGPDIGHQYRSAVFYLNTEQQVVTEKLIGLLRKKGYDVATEVTVATTFWEAENYHQDYYASNGALPYCHFYEQKF